jgi:hypothetical protein
MRDAKGAALLKLLVGATTHEFNLPPEQWYYPSKSN